MAIAVYCEVSHQAAESVARLGIQGERRGDADQNVTAQAIRRLLVRDRIGGGVKDGTPSCDGKTVAMASRRHVVVFLMSRPSSRLFCVGRTRCLLGLAGSISTTLGDLGDRGSGSDKRTAASCRFRVNLVPSLLILGRNRVQSHRDWVAEPRRCSRLARQVCLLVRENGTNPRAGQTCAAISACSRRCNRIKPPPLPTYCCLVEWVCQHQSRLLP